MRLTLLTVFFTTLAITCVIIFLRNRDSDTKKSTFVRTFIKAGAPDQMEETEIADLENNKMVSEGSQFGVQYFNKFMHD